jgi:hypothetical protein
MRRWLLLLVVALCAVACSDGEPDGPSASLTTPPSTEAPTVEDEVEAAYLRSWEVYAEAVLELDPSGLEESYAGTALQTVAAEVARRRADRRPARVRVDHDLSVRVVNSTTAIVIDRYTNHSVRLDPDSLEPVEPDPNEQITESYNLTRAEERWKVSGIVRQR